MKNTLLFILISALILIGCKKDYSVPSEPSSQTSVIKGEPKSYTFNVNPDSLFVASDSIVQIDFSQSHPELNNDFWIPHLLTAESTYPDSVIHYYSIAHQDTFTFDLLYAFYDVNWDLHINMYIDSSRIGEFVRIQLLRVRDSTHADYRFRFFASDTGMGYLQISQLLDYDNYGVIIGLAVEPLSQIQLNLDEIISTSTIDDFAAHGGLFISGSTNAYRIRSESYGDGIIQAYEIPINEDGSFSANIAGRFQFGGTQFIHPSGKLALYGCAGPPIIVKIEGLDK